MIETAYTDYAADYDTADEMLIVSRYFNGKSEKSYQKIPTTFFSHRPKIIFFAFLCRKFQLYPGKQISHNLYQRLFLPIPDTADCLIIGTDYAYCIVLYL